MAFFAVFAGSCSDNDDDERFITMGQMPQVAQTFVSGFFPGVEVHRVEIEYDKYGYAEYKVYLRNGFEIEFDDLGAWTDIDAPSGAVIPAGIAPAAIEYFVAENYPYDGINEISVERYGYDIELVSGVDLEFDANGNLLRIDY